MSETKSAPVNPPSDSGMGIPPVRKKLNSPFVLWPATIVLAAVLFFGLDYLISAFTQESTDDAFIAAHVVSVAPRISGQTLAVHVADNQLVFSNELLVEIDAAHYAALAAQKEAAAVAQEANYRAFLASEALMSNKVTTAEAAAAQAQDAVVAAEATATRAKADFQRMKELRQQNTISQQEFDAAQAAATQAEADWKAAQKNSQASVSRVDEARATLTATEAAIAMALAQWQEAQTNIASALLDLSYARIFAPAAGRVTRKAVEAGDYLQIGQQIMSIVPVEVWVVANFKESQLKDMQTNQPVTVEIDALGGKKFRAHVDSVQAGSGAQFSLLPPENATGNFVKVVQRVPVKIVFDEPLPADKVIGPGLSVTPSVQTSSWRVPDFVTAIIAIILAVAAAVIFKKISGRE